MSTLTTCPTFIDLRAFAATHTGFAADPFGAGRHLLPLRPAPVEVGTINLAPGAGKGAPVEGDLWLVVASGELTFTTAAGATRLACGASCVIPSGTAFAWTATAATVLIFMRYVNGSGQDAAIVPIDATATLAPSGAPLADLLVGPTPVCRNHTDYRSSDGEFTCGVWDSTPYHRRAMSYRHFELMVLLEGSVTFVDELGSEGTFGKGDIFLVEQGAQCSWQSSEQVAKIYAIFRPVD